MWVQGTKLKTSGKIISTLNHWAITWEGQTKIYIFCRKAVSIWHLPVKCAQQPLCRYLPCRATPCICPAPHIYAPMTYRSMYDQRRQSQNNLTGPFIFSFPIVMMHLTYTRFAGSMNLIVFRMWGRKGLTPLNFLEPISVKSNIWNSLSPSSGCLCPLEPSPVSSSFWLNFLNTRLPLPFLWVLHEVNIGTFVYR